MNYHWQQAQIYSMYAKPMVCVFKARLQWSRTQIITMLFGETLNQHKTFVSAYRAATYF